MNIKLLQFTLYTIIILLAGVTVTLLATPVTGLPDEVAKLLSAEAALQVIAVIGFVTAAKNLFPGMKGFIAVAFTIVASLFLGVIQYGLGTNSVWHGLVIGSVAAYTFFVTNNFGRLLNFDPIASTDKAGWRQAVSIVKYILARLTK